MLDNKSDVRYNVKHDVTQYQVLNAWKNLHCKLPRLCNTLFENSDDLRGYRIMVITSVFQTDDVSSILTSRSTMIYFV